MSKKEINPDYNIIIIIFVAKKKQMSWLYEWTSTCRGTKSLYPGYPDTDEHFLNHKEWGTIWMTSHIHLLNMMPEGTKKRGES